MRMKNRKLAWFLNVLTRCPFLDISFNRFAPGFIIDWPSDIHRRATLLKTLWLTGCGT
jgi:hypothetical protein